MGIADLQQKSVRGTAVVAHAPSGLAVLRPLLLVLLLGIVVGAMAYQAPPRGQVDVGWLGDRLFLDTSPGLGAEPAERGDLFADDLNPDSPTGRSRWTREYARLVLPNIGAGADLDLVLLVQGWPADVVGATVAQPDVALFADGTPLGSFRPDSSWAEQHFRVPASVRAGGDLVLELRSSNSFTDTLTFRDDPRPKALRLAELRVSPAQDDPQAAYPPALPALLLLCANSLLLYLLVVRLLRALPAAYALTTIGTGLAGIGLAATRIWMGAALSVGILVLAGLLLAAWQGTLFGLARALVRRYVGGRAIGYGLVAAAFTWFAYTLAQLLGWLGTRGKPLFWAIFPDSLLYGLLGAGLLALLLVRGREGLPRVADRIVGAIGSRRGALLLLVGFGLILLGYETVVITSLPYVGHADYADNAVVARNLVAGRGWVVDYVTQFYHIDPGLTRPQETWPLLQPVWIAPFFALFGPTNRAAKQPNLCFNAALNWLIYTIGTQIWDRRVGLTAAVLVLTNYLFFRLTIYATNDLAFVVFSLGALFYLYQAGRLQRGIYLNRMLLASGVLAGLMMLQKPSGAMIVLGMGLWQLRDLPALLQTERAGRWRALRATVWPVIAWAALALIVLSPYLIRNLLLFGRPVYSTESYDAWVLGYRGSSGEAWADIYRIFAPELGGPGLPDRSWILRWGFDATITKLQTQIGALRDYLLPVWRGLPDGLSWLWSRNEAKNIASDLGAWLALIGLLGALRFRRRLLGLLATAFAPYILFMLTYWRSDEERYWVMLLPWLALLGAWVIWAGYDRLAAIGDRRWAPLGLILAGVAISSVVGFSRADIADKVRNEPGPTQWAPDLAAYTWVKEHTAPGTAMMTRIPWQFNWHTERPAVMIPNTADRAMLLQIAHYYGAEYLVLENQLRVKSDAGRLLSPLLRPGSAQVGATIDGFELVYASPTADFRAFVYRIP